MKPIILVVDAPRMHLHEMLPRLAEAGELVLIDSKREEPKLAPVDLVLPLIADDRADRESALQCGFAAALQKPGAEPKWNVIFPRGKWHGPNFAKVGGSFSVDDGFMGEVVENWKAAGSPRIPVRWLHAHMEGKATPDQMRMLDRKAGNVTDLRITAAGLEGLTEWTKEGAADVETGAFDGWSAEWFPRHTNRLTGETRGWWLSGVALTNDPYFNLLPRIAASLVESTQPTNEQEQHVNPEQLKKWALSLGLSADATFEQCLKASADQGVELNALKASAKPAADTGAITAAVKAAVEPMQEQLKAAQVETKALKASLLERDVDALIATAKKGDGKNGRAITDPLAAIAKDLAQSKGVKAAEEFLTALPLSVPLTTSSVQGTDEVLTAETAGKKLLARANEIRAKDPNDPNPMVTAMREMPREALIAEGRPTTNA